MNKFNKMPAVTPISHISYASILTNPLASQNEDVNYE